MSKITEDKAEEILNANEAPDDVKIKGLPFMLYAELDGRPQELKKLRPFLSVQPVPGDLPQLAQEVMKLLFNCFERQGHVSEGLIGDVMFGFEAVGIPPVVTYEGLQLLQKAGYVAFQAKDGSFIDVSSDKITSAWVRYTPKLLALVYS